MHRELYMYIHALRITVVSALLLGACAADTDDPEFTVDFATEAVQEPTASDVTTSAAALYQELTARLDERGVSIEVMQAAVDAGDEERIRELFGFTDEEMEAAHQRVLAVAEGSAEAPADTPGELEACKGTWAPCMAGVAWGARAFAASGWLALAIYTVGAVTCVAEACDWELPGRSQP